MSIGFSEKEEGDRGRGAGGGEGDGREKKQLVASRIEHITFWYETMLQPLEPPSQSNI